MTTATVSLSKSEKLELVSYTLSLCGLKSTGLTVKAARHNLSTVYARLLEDPARKPYANAKADIEYVFGECGWELPKPIKAKPVKPSAAQVAEAKVAKAKADKAPSHPPTMTYRQLQAACKAAGLKASGKREVLERRLQGYTAQAKTSEVASDDTLSIAKTAQAKATKPQPNAPKAKRPKAAPKAKRTELGLSYREAQAVVKFCKGCGGFDTSALVKNVGWDGVAHNLVILASQPMFAKFDRATLAANPAVAKAVAAVKAA